MKRTQVKLSMSLRRAIMDAFIWAPFKWYAGDTQDTFIIDWRGRQYEIRIVTMRLDD